MQALDATGRKVSLLNDDFNGYEKVQQRQLSFQSASVSRPYPSPTISNSSPNTPELLRSDSYDSQMSNDPISPLTPDADFAYARSSMIPHASHEYGDAPPAKRPAYLDSSRSTSFEDDVSATSPLPERSGKRYPCRYRDTHGCEKTFTTSGHASRHSKIHTAEKAVQCTYLGCQKKFTRADNMKQHLETHYKDKSRTPGSQRVHGKASALAEARRNSLSGRRSGPDSRQWDMDQQQPLPSAPVAGHNAASWNVHNINSSLGSPRATANTPSSGLDALAMAVACQESS